eukprot:sb/3468910/
MGDKYIPYILEISLPIPASTNSRSRFLLYFHLYFYQETTESSFFSTEPNRTEFLKSFYRTEPNFAAEPNFGTEPNRTEFFHETGLQIIVVFLISKLITRLVHTHECRSKHNEPDFWPFFGQKFGKIRSKFPPNRTEPNRRKNTESPNRTEPNIRSLPANCPPLPTNHMTIFTGFPIFGPYDENGEMLTARNLDECGGRLDSNSQYKYHFVADNPNFFHCLKGENFFPARVNAEGIHPDAFCKKA